MAAVAVRRDGLKKEVRTGKGEGKVREIIGTMTNPPVRLKLLESVAQPWRLHKLRILQIYFLITKLRTAFLLYSGKNTKFPRNSQNSLGRSGIFKLHQTLPFLPDPAGGAYSAPPDPLAVSGGGEGEGRGGGREGKAGRTPLARILDPPLRNLRVYTE